MSRVSMVCFVVVTSFLMAMSSAHSVCAQVATTAGAGRNSTSRFQSRAEIAALPPSSTGNALRVGFMANAPAIGNQVAGNRGYSYHTSSANADVYPYPASRAPRVALQTNYTLPRSISQTPLANQLSIGSNSTIGSQRNTTRPSRFTSRASYPTQVRMQQTTAYRQSSYLTPTLGLSNPSIRTAQNCNCQSGNWAAATNRTTAAYQIPTLNSAVGSGLAVPPLNITDPGQQEFIQPSLPPYGQSSLQPNYRYPPAGAQQYGSQGASWRTPFVTGSGHYTPVVRLQNMPVGTYLGQGFIGQPTAYVDGQPVRNLLRYISP